MIQFFIQIIHVFELVLKQFSTLGYDMFSDWWFQPLWKKSSSVGIIIPSIWKNKIHVPNHHPVHIYMLYYICHTMYVQCRKNNPHVPKHQPVLFPMFFQDVQFFTSHHPKPTMEGYPPVIKHGNGTLPLLTIRWCEKLSRLWKMISPNLYFQSF